MNTALAALQQAGHTMIDRAGRPGGRRSLIGFVHPKSFNGLLMHLVHNSQQYLRKNLVADINNGIAMR